jgi:hypothetical protein
MVLKLVELMDSMSVILSVATWVVHLDMKLVVSMESYLVGLKEKSLEY